MKSRVFIYDIFRYGEYVTYVICPKYHYSLSFPSFNTNKSTKQEMIYVALYLQRDFGFFFYIYNIVHVTHNIILWK